MASTFTLGVYAKSITERFGWGVTLNPDGSKNAITGPEIVVYTDTPEGVVSALPGSMVLATGPGSATWWGKLTGSGNTGWSQIPTGAGGGGYADDVKLYFGSANQTWIVYASATKELTATTKPITSTLGTEAVYNLVDSTGTVTVTGAVVGPGSGYLNVSTGNTIANNAGATAGTTGALTLSTGSSTAVAGAAGASGSAYLLTGAGASTGSVFVQTGNAAAGNSGNVDLTTGTASGTRGRVRSLAAFETQSAIYQVGTQTALNPGSGSTVTIANNTAIVYVSLAAPIANLTFDFGAGSAAANGRRIQVVVTDNITGAITLTSAGATFARAVSILDTGAPFDAVTNPWYTFTYQYSHTTTTWYRVG